MAASSDVVVRHVRPDEHSQVFRVLLAAYTAAWGPAGWDDYRDELAAVDARSRVATVLVAVEGDDVVGTVTLVNPDSEMARPLERNACELRMLAVHPDAQGRGVGEALVRAAAALAGQSNHAQLVLQSDEDLLAAHRLYRRFGFQRDESLDETVADGIVAHGYRHLTERLWS
jgi:ribosomal protein S18 acetylase RimI-like enzyme